MCRDEHIAVARRFERHLATLEGLQASLGAQDRLWEWIIVVRYYVVVHYMDGWLVHMTGSAPENHHERNQAVRRRTRHWPRCKSLFDKSQEARYFGTRFSDAAAQSNRRTYEALRVDLLRDLGIA